MKVPFSAYDFFGYLACGFMVISAADFAFGQSRLFQSEWGVVPTVALIFAAYVMGHAIAHLASLALEKGLVRKVLGSPEKTLFDSSRTGGWGRIFPGFYEPIPDETRRRVLERAKDRAGITSPGRGLFFHCHPIVMREQACSGRLNSFLHLYGFGRNTCMASLIATVILVGGALSKVRVDESEVTVLLTWAGVALLVAVVMLYRYLKFFRLYTVEVFRTYAEQERDN
jgi:hypothetical protein